MRATKHLLLWTSLGTFLLLAWAAFTENSIQEWRLLQRRYRDLLPAERRDDFSMQLRQIVVPVLKVSDRCVTCHLGMAPGETGIGEVRLFAPHPPIPHDPGEFGCTTCHGGQGRATEKEAAHGTVAHWPEPMIPAKMSYAGCGACHSHLAVAHSDLLRHGESLYLRHDCAACHAIDGRGGTHRADARYDAALGPDLSRIGSRDELPDWYDDHIARREDADAGPWRISFGEIPDDERAAIDRYLSMRVGAPGLVESKSLFHSLGCRGCHAIGGVGGDDGPDLTRAGQKDPGQLDFSHVPDGRSLGGWLAEHFRAPASVVPGSQMPEQGLTEEEIDALVFYILSLRPLPVPEAFWPIDRIRAERFGIREFATDGATLYGTFCAACHGRAGEGMRYPGMTAFPAIANQDFLSAAPDSFIAAAIRQGRPGRRMPAWGEKEGGLRPAEIDSLVAFVRRLGGGVVHRPSGRPRRWIDVDATRGARLYASHCGGCHGLQGEGGEGSALANRVFLASATDDFLLDTIRRGRRMTTMEGFADPSPIRPALGEDEIRSIVAFVRLWEEKR